VTVEDPTELVVVPKDRAVALVYIGSLEDWEVVAIAEIVVLE